MPIPAFASDVFYSVQNEDLTTELAVLKRLGRNQQRVLMIASAGENVLGLLCQAEVAFVDAVDLSLAQIRLSELRAAAAQQLERDEQLALLRSRFLGSSIHRQGLSLSRIVERWEQTIPTRWGQTSTMGIVPTTLQSTSET